MGENVGHTVAQQKVEAEISGEVEKGRDAREGEELILQFLTVTHVFMWGPKSNVCTYSLRSTNPRLRSSTGQQCNTRRKSKEVTATVSVFKELNGANI